MYEIHPLKVGDIVEPEPRILYLGNCDKTIALGNFFFLIKGDGRNMLVDTGVTKADGDRFNPGVVQSPEDDPFAQLEKHGVTPELVDAVMLSHLHWDHFSPTILRMPDAKLFVNPAELDMVMNPPHPWFARFAYTELIEEFAAQGRFTMTSDGQEIAPGIRVMFTPGHTFGGQSAVVQTTSGAAVITGDVCFTYRNLDEDTPGGFNYNLIECFNSLQRIRETADIVLPGHDLSMLEKYPNGVK